MNIRRFVANLEMARKYAKDVVTARNDIARAHAVDILDSNIDNMIEELNTIIKAGIIDIIDKDAFLKSLLEDAELQR